MNPVQIALLVLFVVLVAIAAFALVRSTEKPKRFGLKEAEAAAQYVGNADAARSVMAVVIGVLEYENMVAKELTDASLAADNLNEGAHNEIEGANREIEALRRTVDQLQTQINNREAEFAEKKRIAALFVA